MDVRSQYKLWLEKTQNDSALSRELAGIADNEAAVADRFWRDLEFGTGGLRGIIGAGTNRMNIYTVGKATQGLCGYLLSQSEKPSVAVAYDTRNMSYEFAMHTACVCAANGIAVNLYDTAHPTPMLSFAVRHLHTDAGIVITASHNPKQYNGYKVYGPDGGQITDAAAAAILARINACDIFDGVKFITQEKAKKSGLIRIIGGDVDARYFEEIKSLYMRRELIEEKAHDLKILYTPLNGSGNIPVRRVLRESGFSNVDIVAEQELPDGDFPTTPYPNPEEREVFELAVLKAETTNPDLVFATDPDCDRIGVLSKTPSGKYETLTGNQVGALLCDYILKTKRESGNLRENPAVIKTVVTTGLAEAICGEYNVALIEVLTGFKYIGEKIGEWERNHLHSFIFGFEESCGYLAGGFVRDKDAVIAAALLCEMTLYYKERGLSLYAALEGLYAKYGYYAEKLISFTMPGEDGQRQIANIIGDLRDNHIKMLKDRGLVISEDYRLSTRIFIEPEKREQIELPASNMLRLIFKDGSRLVLRPSGTEPKMKLYIGVKARDDAAAQEKICDLQQALRRCSGSFPDVFS